MARTFQKVQLGTRLRRLREDAGVTPEVALAAIDKGHLRPDTLRKIETGERFFSKLEVTTLARSFGATEGEVTLIRRLWDQASEPSKFTRYGLPDTVIEYLDMEHAAGTIRTVNGLMVHGIMQIPSYAQRVFELAGGVTEDTGEIEQRVLARTQRQDRLRRSTDNPNPLRVTTVIGEEVLRRCANEPEGPDQLAILIEFANLENVEILVIGLNAGLHAGLLGDFTILEFESIDSHVYLETAAGGQAINEPSMVEFLERKFEELRSQALDATESLTFIAELINNAG